MGNRARPLQGDAAGLRSLAEVRPGDPASRLRERPDRAGARRHPDHDAAADHYARGYRQRRRPLHQSARPRPRPAGDEGHRAGQGRLRAAARSFGEQILPKDRYLFVFTQFRTQNRSTLLLELL
ncbi:hypothetical protein BOSE46_40497 [Bosea sp. 46]|nr:hypothetical protein BOSE46_40497 [Bosea sp. 46]VXC38113.1 hypothetical protein BOSE29B_30825 [Bosea sp. 29B]